MPLTACPECRHVAAVRSEQLGHRTRCPNCAQTFRPERMPVSFHRFFRAGHAGGAWVAAILLIVGVVLVISGGASSLTFDRGRAEIFSSLSSHLELDAAAVCLVVGVLLLTRHINALVKRPHAVGSRKPGGVVTPFGPARPPKQDPA